MSERYGVPGSLTAEPAIVDIRNGSRVLHNIVLLKKFQEDLNTLEVFAYAHNKIEKLFGQLLLDVANHLPGVLKRRYLDYLNHLGLDLNKPGFDSLRNFVGHELKIMTSEYAQMFFKQNEKSGEFGNSRNTVHVCQFIVKSNDAKSQTVSSKAESPNSNGFKSNRKLPPVCFYCNDTSLKHYLGDCEKFKKLGLEHRRQVVIEARRCLNCFGLGHFARNCGFASKCHKCGPIYYLKHATVLHDLYVQSSLVDFKATNTKESVNICDSPSSSKENKHVARKICPSNKIVLLCTCAVKVINPRTGRFTLAYAQHNTASQGTIVFKSWMDKLGLVASKSSEIHICTLANEFTPCRGVVNFELESLTTGERFDVENALVVLKLVDDECVLPHRVDTSGLEHFDCINIPTLPYKRCIDILIGQTDKFLLTVLEKCEGIRPEDPNYVLTRLDPIASGGCGDGRKCSKRKLQTLKVNLECCNKNDCVKLRQEVSALREQLHCYILEDKEIQVSTSDEITRELVELNVNVVNNCYEIPVPLKVDVVKALPNNYAYALDCNFLLRKSALKNNSVKKTLIDTFHEIISNEWLVPIDSNPSCKPCCYLPFFVTKQAKSRVVFDGAATYKGVSLNDAVYPGENLLNGLVDVLTRFRLGKFACMADVSKCFFQVSIPESQCNLFRLIWFKDNDLVNGFTQIYRFTRHVWGVNSSPYIALLAIKRLVSENVTNASPSTLSAILQCCYMDDLLLSSDSLVELETIARESRLLFKSRGFTL